MKSIRYLFKKRSWMEKSDDEINMEIKQGKWIVFCLVAFGALIALFSMLNGLFFHI